jgi:LuxR family maltose regulon positive regulatory protein
VSGCPATLVSAPAGYGKSTLVSQWLDHMGGNAAWLSLDDADNNLRRFASYVVAALDSVQPDGFSETARALCMQQLPEGDELAAILCSDLEALDVPVVLVLDDYHKISAAGVHEFMDSLLRRPPRGLSIVIVTRRDPALALQSLRASGVLLEVRMRQLAFSQAEAIQFMRKKFGDRLEEHMIARLHERTEGWPVGLRLATLAVPESHSADEFIARVPSDVPSVRAYLIQEVLGKCPDTVRDNLLHTSFLDRFNASLCDAVCTAAGKSGPALSGHEFIRWIDEAGLFIIALDDQHQWFRYHHLFQSALQEQASAALGDAGIKLVHERAARWFETHGFFEDAILQLVTAGESTAAAELIIKHRNKIMNTEQWHRLAHWLALLPRGLVDSRPELLLLQARLHRTRGAREEFAETLEAARALLETTGVTDELRRELLGSLESSHCYNLWLQSDGVGAASSARRALDLLPEESLAERGFAMIVLGVALQMSSEARKALDVIYAAMPDESSAANHPTFVSRLLVALIGIHWMDADLDGVRSSANELESSSSAAGLMEVLTIAINYQSAVDYHHNRLHAVVARLDDVARSDVVISAEFHAQSMIIAALAHLELGDRQEAMRIVPLLRELALKSRNVFLVGVADAFEAEFALRTGRLAAAVAWTKHYDPEPITSSYTFFSPPMVLAKILVVADTPSSRDRATAILDRLVDYFTAVHNNRFLIEALALRAMLRDAIGETESAMTDAALAVRLAQPGRFIRLFVDLGPRLGALLARLKVDEEALTYVGEIIAAFEPLESDISIDVAPAPIGLRRVGVEALSKRELQVLGLLAARLNNSEIADRLHISTVTVKRHVANIYQKLGVHGRREAVAKAEGLGMLKRSA